MFLVKSSWITVTTVEARMTTFRACNVRQVSTILRKDACSARITATLVIQKGVFCVKSDTSSTRRIRSVRGARSKTA